MDNINGYQGQIRAVDQPQGYFSAGTNLMSLIENSACIENPVVIRIGIDSNPTTLFNINGENIKIGKTGMYEICNVYVTEFTILSDSTPETIIDYIIRVPDSW